MPLKINVPYSEKDIAKSKGALWNAEQKSWFVPDHKNINDFLQWIDTKNISTIIKSPFFIAVNSKECYKCAESTTVIALASNDFYCLDYDANDNQKWLQMHDLFFFPMPVHMNTEVTDLLNRLFPQFKKGYSKTVGGKYWANHCERCGVLQGDWHMHSEPGGAFSPMEIEQCKELTLISINTDFYVEFKADTSWASNSDEILYYANSIDLQEFLKQGSVRPPRITVSHSKDSIVAKNTPKLLSVIWKKVKSFID